MNASSKTRLPPVEARGRTLLAVALLVLAASVVSSALEHDLSSLKALGSASVGYGPLLLILYFAFHGGGCSLSVVRVILLAFGGLLLFGTLLVVLAPAADKPADFTLSDMYSLQSLPMLFCYGFFCWIFFLSRSVRAYIRHVREVQRGIDPFPLPSKPADQA